MSEQSIWTIDALRAENERLTNAVIKQAELRKKAEAEAERLRGELEGLQIQRNADQIEAERRSSQITDEDVIRAQTAFSEYEARNGRYGWSPRAPSAAMRAALEAARS